MKINLSVRVDGMYSNFGAGIEIPELYTRCFEPLKTCDDVMVAMATGDVMEDAARVIMKTREDAAEILSKELTKLIVSVMKKNDTHNGY